MKPTYYRPSNYWVLEVFFLALLQNEKFELKPDGYSYIIYSVYEKVATYYRPSLDSLLIKADSTSKYFIVKCRPTYVFRLQEQKVCFTNLATSQEFWDQLQSKEFRNFCPILFDSILFHLHFKEGNASLESLKYRYQFSTIKIKNDFKNFFGISFRQYQKILLNTT